MRWAPSTSNKVGMQLIVLQHVAFFRCFDVGINIKHLKLVRGLHLKWVSHKFMEVMLFTKSSFTSVMLVRGAISRGGCLALAQLELKAIVGSFDRTNNYGLLIKLEIVSVGLVIASRKDCHYEVQNHSWDIKVIRGGDYLSFWSLTSTFLLMFIVEPWKMSIIHILST